MGAGDSLQHPGQTVSVVRCLGTDGIPREQPMSSWLAPVSLEKSQLWGKGICLHESLCSTVFPLPHHALYLRPPICRSVCHHSIYPFFQSSDTSSLCPLIPSSICPHISVPPPDIPLSHTPRNQPSFILKCPLLFSYKNPLCPGELTRPCPSCMTCLSCPQRWLPSLRDG